MRSLALRHSLIGLGLIGALSAACQSAEDDSGVNEGAATAAERDAMLDVNDVSILFKLDSKGNPFPSYKLTGDNELLGIDLLPSRIVDQVTAAATKLSPAINFSLGGNKASAWRIFGMRFDPCAPGINTDRVKGDKSKCSVQVRLIAQPLGSRAPQDITMHVVYTIGSLDKTDLESIRADLMKIKVASGKAGANTAGQPLGVHPGLAKNDIGTRDALSAFIKKYAPKQTQTAIAFMGLQNDGFEPWEFFAGAVVPVVGFVNLADIPGLGGMPSLPARSKNVAFQPFSSPAVSPAPVNRSTAPLFGAASDASSVAFEIENPATTHFFNADCVSCHTSTQKTVAFQTKSNNKRVRVPAGITGYVSPTVLQNSSWNVRNFGYFDTNPSVSLRTVTETVEVVEFLNEGHKSVDPRAAKFVGPGNDCTAVDDAVWDCFLTNADGKGGSSCMTKNKCVPFPLEAAPAPPDSEPVPLGPLPDPNTDPCLAGPEASGLKIDGNTITMTGKANECFSRSFSAFKIHNAEPGDSNDTAVKIICNAGTECFVTVSSLTEPTTISGKDGRRLSFLLSKVSADHKFVANTKDGSLGISCANLICTITPPAAK